MFDLDGRVRQWRERQASTSSLSPRELDELEDHLRARVDLEMELNAVLAPEKAFAIARHELGEAAALSKEFAKVGKPKWRRWLVAGWAAYAAAWFLPMLRIELFGGGATMYGHQLFLDPEAIIVLLPVHLAMLMTVSALWGGRCSRARWLRWLLGCAGGLLLGWIGALAGYGVFSEGWTVLPKLIFTSAFWSWGGSMVCAAVGLRLRAREWESATPKRVSA